MKYTFIAIILLQYILLTSITDANSDLYKTAIIIHHESSLLNDINNNTSILYKFQQGSIVSINERKTINNITWYKIAFNDLSGWINENDISFQYYYDSNMKLYHWVIEVDNPNHKYGFIKIICIKYLSNNEILQIRTEPDMCRYYFSRNYKYVVADLGSDIIGSIHVYDVKSNKLIHKDSFTRHKIEWTGNNFYYDRVIKVTWGNKFYLWERMYFKDGKVIKGTKKGKGQYHG